MHRNRRRALGARRSGRAGGGGGGVRRSTKRDPVVAVVVVVWVAVARLRTAPATTARVGAAVSVVAYGLLPAAALFGWHYVRNNALYGDFAGSEFLLDRFGRTPAWFPRSTSSPGATCGSTSTTC